MQLYDKVFSNYNSAIADNVYLQVGEDVLSEVFKEKYNKKPIFKKYGTKKEMQVFKQLLNHCSLAFRETYIRSVKEYENTLLSLKELLGLKKIPRIIDGFDISNFGSSIIVASTVRFENGIPDRKNYRHYKMKYVTHQSDVDSMKEVSARRGLQFVNGETIFADLWLIDGGKAQVNAVKQVLDRMNLDIDVVGLAKKEELIIIPDKKEPVRLKIDSKELRLFMAIRDEAHRFANRYREMLQYKFK